MSPTGCTRIYFILGDPIAQVRAPEIYNPLFEAHGVDALLVPVQVRPDDVVAFAQAALRAGNVDGLWLTIPHKSALLDELDSCDEQGRLAGAVNAVRRDADGRLHGALFDGTGLIQALRGFGLSLAGRRVLLLGAGGAGLAIAAALLLDRQEPPVADIAFVDAQPGRAAQAAARLQAGVLPGPTGATSVRLRTLDQPDPAGYDLIINATPLGLNAGDALPVDVTRIDTGAAVVDILMKQADTALVRACRQRGIKAWPGHEMLTRQVGDYLRFFGHADLADQVDADLDRVRALFGAVPPRERGVAPALFHP
jgi:shikimate dehydrogenase